MSEHPQIRSGPIAISELEAYHPTVLWYLEVIGMMYCRSSQSVVLLCRGNHGKRKVKFIPRLTEKLAQTGYTCGYTSF